MIMTSNLIFVFLCSSSCCTSTTTTAPRVTSRGVPSSNNVIIFSSSSSQSKDSTAGDRTPQRLPITIGPMLPASCGFLLPLPGQRTTLWRAPSSSTWSQLQNSLTPSAILSTNNVCHLFPLPGRVSSADLLIPDSIT